MCKGNDTDEARVMCTVVFRRPQNQSHSVFPCHDLQKAFKIYMQGEAITKGAEAWEEFLPVQVFISFLSSLLSRAEANSKVPPHTSYK